MANDNKTKIDTLKNDTKDTANELKHRAQATGEHVKRAVEGDAMPLGERIASNVKEKVKWTQAEIDAAKREGRHDLENEDDKG